MAVEYISTLAVTKASLLHRQARILPRLEAALEVVDVLEAQLGKDRRRRSSTLAALAIGNHRTRDKLRQLATAARELRERHMDRVGQLAALDLLRFPHVEEQRILRVDEWRDAERADVAPAGKAAADERPDQHRARNDERRDEHPILFDEFKQGHR